MTWYKNDFFWLCLAAFLLGMLTACRAKKETVSESRAATTAAQAVQLEAAQLCEQWAFMPAQVNTQLAGLSAPACSVHAPAFWLLPPTTLPPITLTRSLKWNNFRCSSTDSTATERKVTQMRSPSRRLSLASIILLVVVIGFLAWLISHAFNRRYP